MYSLTRDFGKIRETALVASSPRNVEALEELVQAGEVAVADEDDDDEDSEELSDEFASNSTGLARRLAYVRSMLSRSRGSSEESGQMAPPPLMRSISEPEHTPGAGDTPFMGSSRALGGSHHHTRSTDISYDILSKRVQVHCMLI